MKRKDLIQRHIFLPKEMDEKICELAKKRDMKITAIIRQTIKEFLERKENESPNQRP